MFKTPFDKHLHNVRQLSAAPKIQRNQIIFFQKTPREELLVTPHFCVRELNENRLKSILNSLKLSVRNYNPKINFLSNNWSICTIFPKPSSLSKSFLRILDPEILTFCIQIYEYMKYTYGTLGAGWEKAQLYGKEEAELTPT